MKRAVKSSLEAVKSLLGILDHLPLAEPVIKGAVKALEAIEGTETNDAELNVLVDYVCKLMLAISSALIQVPEADISPRLKMSLEDLAGVLDEISTFAHAYSRRSKFKKVVMNKGETAKIKDFTLELDRAMRIFAVQNTARLSVDMTGTRADMKTMAEAVASGTAYLYSNSETLNAVRLEQARLSDQGSTVVNVVQRLEGRFEDIDYREAFSRMQQDICTLNSALNSQSHAVLTAVNDLSAESRNIYLRRPTIMDSSLYTTTHSPMRFSFTKVSRPGRLTCLQSCQCRCHRPALIRSPKILSPLLGEFYIKYTGVTFGTTSLARCDEQTCRSSQARAQIKYYLPLWFRLRLGFALTVSPLTIHIQTRRQLSFDDSIFHSILFGEDLEEIAQTFRSHGSLINSVNEYGEGVIHYGSYWLAYYGYDSEDMLDSISYATRLVTLLIEHGADPAWRDNDNRCAKTLLMDHCIAVTRHESVKDRNAGLMEIALAFGMSPRDMWDEYLEAREFTDVHAALFGIHTEGLGLDEVLLRISRNPEMRDVTNTRDLKGWSPLAWAVCYGWPSAVDSLLSHGADPNQEVQSLYGGRSTLLTLAILGRSWSPDDTLQIFIMLLSASANVNIPDDQGMTILHWLVRAGHYKVAVELAKFSGEDLNWDARTNAGETALDIAKRYHCGPELLILLINRGVPSAERQLELLEQLQADGTVDKRWYINDSGDLPWPYSPNEGEADLSDDEDSVDEANLSDEEDSVDEFHDAVEDIEES